MTDHLRKSRRDLLKRIATGISGALLAPVHRLRAQSPQSDPRPNHPSGDRHTSVTQFGAVPDGKTLNTASIQAAIDALAANHGGTLSIPAGEFLTGALFLKPGVHLHLERGAILKGSTDRAHYPTRRTRVEGHFEDWLPALINANHCDHLRITGADSSNCILDGNGYPFWQEFWARRAANPKTTNLDVPRPRLALIENSSNIQIRGITFRNSGFWNLHLYRCSDVQIENLRFEVPDNQRCPSTDGTDLDSCQRVTIRNCTYRVDDDCICLKGSKGPFALNDKDSPPVEQIHVDNCTFERGGGIVTLGSEATIIRNVLVENCKVPGKIPIVRLKLRPDTPQTYEQIHYRKIALIGNLPGAGTGDRPGSHAAIFDIRPWQQYFDLKGQPPPQSTVRNITVEEIQGTYGSFGEIQGNPKQTTLTNIHLKNIDVHLDDPTLKTGAIPGITVENVRVNGQPLQIGRT